MAKLEKEKGDLLLQQQLLQQMPAGQHGQAIFMRILPQQLLAAGECNSFSAGSLFPAGSLGGPKHISLRTSSEKVLLKDMILYDPSSRSFS